jgi:uncharacterized damage-inducible protein DinB
MLALLRDLVSHKGHANASVLSVVRRSLDAASDRDILALLHHILIANRFWICAVRRVTFVPDDEVGTLQSCDALLEAYRRTQEEESAWLAAATDADCAAALEHPFIPGGRCSVAQAFMQVCMHSHGHRAQLAKLLRRHDVVPPETDFILWLTTRAEPEWSTERRPRTAG